MAASRGFLEGQTGRVEGLAVFEQTSSRMRKPESAVRLPSVLPSTDFGVGLGGRTVGGRLVPAYFTESTHFGGSGVVIVRWFAILTEHQRSKKTKRLR